MYRQHTAHDFFIEFFLFIQFKFFEFIILIVIDRLVTRTFMLWRCIDKREFNFGIIMLWNI